MAISKIEVAEGRLSIRNFRLGKTDKLDDNPYVSKSFHVDKILSKIVCHCHKIEMLFTIPQVSRRG